MKRKKTTMRRSSTLLSLLCSGVFALRTVDVGSKWTQTFEFVEEVVVVVTAVDGWQHGQKASDLQNQTVLQEICGGASLFCSGVVVDDNKGAHMNPAVAVCKKKEGVECPYRVHAREPRPDKLALCVPSLRDDYLTPEMQPFLEKYLEYYVGRHGASRVFFYGLDVDAPNWMNNLRHTQAITWVKWTFDASVFHYYAQNWVVQDCLHRATEEGFEHILSLDVDEFLTFADPAMTIVNYIRDHVHYGTDASTFGSVVEHLNATCDDYERTVCGREGPPDVDAVTCGPMNHCKTSRKYANHKLCCGACGHRKHITFGPRMLSASVHTAPYVKLGLANVHDVSTDQAYLRHFQRQKLNANQCPSCLLLPK